MPLPLLLPAADWHARIAAVVATAVFALLLFGATGAVLGGAGIVRGALRVLVGGVLAMGITYAAGAAFGARMA